MIVLMCPSLSVYSVPDMVLWTLHILSHVIFRTTLDTSTNIVPHFPGVETEAQSLRNLSKACETGRGIIIFASSGYLLGVKQLNMLVPTKCTTIYMLICLNQRQGREHSLSNGPNCYLSFLNK